MKFISITSASHPDQNITCVASGSPRQRLITACLAMVVTGPAFAAGITPSQEVTLLTQLSRSGNHDAQLQLGLAYQEGRYDLQPDPEAARHWLAEAASGGQAYAADVLANDYANGTGTAVDMASALHWWLVAADGDNADAQTHLGEQLLADGNEEGKDWLEKAAEQGNSRAQTDLKKLYSQEEVPASDLNLGKDSMNTLSARLKLPALKLFSAVWKTLSIDYAAQGSANRLQQDASNGDPVAEYQLAMYYRDGNWGVQRDPNKAFYWLRKSANDGNPVAMKTLAEVYRKGDMGVMRDSSRAAKWDARARQS